MASAAQIAYPHVVKEAGYCGGKAAIDDTRVRVADVVHLHRRGATPEQILVQYPDLSLAQVHSALGYYYDHRDEIDATLAQEDTVETEYERAKSEYLSRRPAQ